MTQIMIFAVLAGFSTLLFRIILSHRPFYLENIMVLLISSSFGLVLWVVLIIWSVTTALISVLDIYDVGCGILIQLCAFWCNYWIGTLGAGFRIQMMANLADQTNPASLEAWMAAFGGLGLDMFLKDRIKSILIPLKIVSIENDQMILLPGWGLFFARLMAVLQILLSQVRSE